MKLRFKNKLVAIGFWLLVIGAGPLLLFVLLDMLGFNVSNNPVGLGLLFFFTTPIALLLLAIGSLLPRAKTQEPLSEPQPAVEDQEPAKPELTPEEQSYINDKSWAGCWGLFYYIYMDAASAFFAHLPSNFVYTNVINNARTQVWESGKWSDFTEFKRRTDAADKSARIVMVGGLIIVLALIFF